MRLFVRPVPVSGEPLDLLLVRTCEVNRAGSPVRLVRALGLAADCRTRRRDLSALADALGCAQGPASLGRSARWLDPASGLVTVGDLALPSAVLGPSLGRVCPRCVAEGTVFDRAWEMKAVVACTRHATWLADTCGGCGRAIGRNRARVASCRCGRSLAEGGCPAPGAAVSMVRRLVDSGATAVHPLPVGEAARLVWFAGVRSHGALRRGATIDRPGIRDTWDLLEPVAGILDEWPLRFVEWVSARARKDARGGSLYEHHPLALDILREFGGSCPAIPGVLADAFAADASMPPIRTNSRFHRKGAATLNASGAARILGVAPPTVARRIGEGTLPGWVAGAGRRRAVAVSREHAVLASRAAVPPDTVASRFGLSRTQMAGLRTGSGLAPRSRDDMERVVLQLDGRVGCGLPPEDAIALAAVPTLRGPTLLAAVSLVIEGRLPCWSLAAHEPAFRRLLVSRSQLLREAGGGLSVREVAGCLRVPIRLIPLLVGAGCLEASGAPGRRRITRAAVAKCAERYATAGEIAAVARTNTRTLLARLDTAKVEPVIPSDPASGISSVWRREEVEAVAGRLRPRLWRSR